MRQGIEGIVEADDRSTAVAPPPNRRWTQTDITKLRRECDGLATLPELAVTLQRSSGDVTQMLRRLRLNAPLA